MNSLIKYKKVKTIYYPFIISSTYHLMMRLNQLRESNYYKVLIKEDWCGDAMMNIPILKHTIEFLNIKARVFHEMMIHI